MHTYLYDLPLFVIVVATLANFYSPICHIGLPIIYYATGRATANAVYTLFIIIYNRFYREERLSRWCRGRRRRRRWTCFAWDQSNHSPRTTSFDQLV